MSNKVNDELLERANEMMEEFTNHPAHMTERLQAAVDKDDLDELHYLVSICEGILAQEHFEATDII